MQINTCTVLNCEINAYSIHTSPGFLDGRTSIATCENHEVHALDLCMQ